MVGDHFRTPPAWVPAGVDAPGWRVFHVAETGSTNTDLIDAAAAGAPDRIVLTTGHQTAGRGRLDRRWDAPADSNLLMSILFRCDAGRAQAMMRRLSVAASRAVTAMTGLTPTSKWPNDLLLDGRKLAGVLAQGAPGGDAVVIGMGLNVGWAPEGAARLGDGVVASSLIAPILTAFDALTSEGDVEAAYRRQLDTLGRLVRVELPDGAIVGRAVDLDEHGHLVVLDECAISHRIDAGDVVHLRPE